MRFPRPFPLLLTLGALSMPVLAQEQPELTSPEGVVAQPLTQPAPGGKGPGMGRGYQRSTPGPGRGYPGYRSGSAGDGPVRGPAATPAPGLGLGPGKGTAPGLGLPPNPGDLPVYGPPPGLGPGYGGQRYRGGPGYPGLRGPGTSYPGHRQYGSPPRYPIRPPAGQD